MEPLVMEHLESDTEHGKNGLKESVLLCFAKWKRPLTQWKCKRRGILEITETEQCLMLSSPVTSVLMMMCTVFFFPELLLVLTSKAGDLLKSWIFSGLLDLKAVFSSEECLTPLF